MEKNKNKAYIYHDMLRKGTNSGSSAFENRKYDKVIEPLASEPVKIVERRKVQCANPIFDPNSASPGSEFMNILKLRMSIYYEHDLNMFDTK